MLPAAAPSLEHTNRAFCYGDALFETIHASGTRLQFFSDHFKRLQRGMELLGMESGSLPDQPRLENIITRLLNKNHLYHGVRVRITVFRDSGGYYAPGKDSCSFLAETTPLNYHHYRLNDKGLRTGIFDRIVKQNDCLANLKTANSLLYVMAGLHARKSDMDESLILNAEKRIAESVSSNLFLVRDGVLLTPALEEGCVDGVMRLQVLRLAVNEGMDARETQIGERDLISADECFLTNAISGIRWVVAFGKRRYYNKTSKKISALLNREQFGI
jgi:branched-subunit amino acid aminotransferase/4-amino-4-deoxychorismate lyase